MSEMKWPIHEECLKILGSSNYIDLVNQKFYNNEIISNILIAQFGFSKVECVDDYIKFDNKELYEQCTLGFNSDVIQQSRKDMVCFYIIFSLGLSCIVWTHSMVSQNRQYIVHSTLNRKYLKKLKGNKVSKNYKIN